jgi:hypothetical protein
MTPCNLVFIHSSMALQPFVRPWPLLQFRNLFYTVGRTPWTSDQPVARPLPTHRRTQTQINAHTHIHSLSRIRTHDPRVRPPWSAQSGVSSPNFESRPFHNEDGSSTFVQYHVNFMKLHGVTFSISAEYSVAVVGTSTLTCYELQVSFISHPH